MVLKTTQKLWHSASYLQLGGMNILALRGHDNLHSAVQYWQSQWRTQKTFMRGFIQWHRRTRRGIGGGGRPPGLKHFRANSVFSASTICSKILNDKIYFNTVKNFWATLFFRASAVAEKSWIVKNIFNAVKIFRATVFFRANACYSKIVNCEKIFNTVYIQLGAIRVIWASVVCNLDECRDWL